MAKQESRRTHYVILQIIGLQTNDKTAERKALFWAQLGQGASRPFRARRTQQRENR
jgi:hypothetical protein